VLGDWVSKDDVSSALYTMYLSLYKLILFRLTGEEDSVLAATYVYSYLSLVLF